MVKRRHNVFKYIEDLLKNPFTLSLMAERRKAERNLRNIIDHNAFDLLLTREPGRLSAIILAIAYIKEKENNDIVMKRYEKVIGELTSQSQKSINPFKIRSVAQSACRFEKFVEENFWGQSEAIQQIKEVSWSYCFGESLEKTDDFNQIIRRLGVFIHGETGSGKEIIAQAIATGALDRLDDKGKYTIPPFGVQNCAAIPATLLESELFGYKQGAHNTATSDKEGSIIMANGGAFFFDEIGDMPLDLQAKILRVIETKKIQRLGDPTTRDIDIRFVCASNKNLKDMMQKGMFRGDLYFRFGLNIEIPPLRSRKDDIAIISEKYVTKYLGTNSSSAILIDKVRNWLSKPKVKNYGWPGNVRQLLAEIDKLILGVQSEETDLLNFADNTREQDAFPIGILKGEWSENKLKIWYSRHLMALFGNKRGISSKVAQRLGISPSTFSKRQKGMEYENKS